MVSPITNLQHHYLSRQVGASYASEEVNENNTIDLTDCTPSLSCCNIGGIIPNIITLLRSLEDDTNNRHKKKIMKVCVYSALTALKKKKNNTSKNNLTLTTMDSILAVPQVVIPVMMMPVMRKTSTVCQKAIRSHQPIKIHLNLQERK